jgi:putative aldouronate transport system substrate-binding protein
MYKKLVSLVLAAIMAVGMLAGCSQNTEDVDVESADTEATSRVALTLTMWLPCENATPEAQEAVSAAVNRLTQAKYDTALEMKFIPRDQYRDAVEARIQEINDMIEAEEQAAEEYRKWVKEQKAQGITVEETEEEETEETLPLEDETIVNELGITITKYPEVGPKQFDIFLVTSYQQYYDYIENEWIQQLDGELSGNSKLLKTYIYPTFLDLANVGGTYAIPNNHPVGEYQYLLVNKELVDQYDYDPDSLSSVLKCGEFIKDIGNQVKAGKLEGVVPLLGEIEASNMHYFGLNEDKQEWSMIANQITNSMAYFSPCIPKSIFSTNVYINTVGLMKELKELGYVGDGTVKDGEKFAVGVIPGDPASIAEYEDDYYVKVYSKPMMTEEDVYGAMFAVSSYSKSLARSMEIVTYLNTSSDIRTILQYGAQGVHWDYTSEENRDTIKILSNDYKMRITDTGNVYMTYPDAGRPMSDWDTGKQMNLDMISSPFIKFPGVVTEENKPFLEELVTLSKEYKERMDACPFAEWDDFVTEVKKEIKANELISKNLLDNTGEVSTSILGFYNDWHDENYPS